MEGVTILAEGVSVDMNPLTIVLWYALPVIIGMVLGALIDEYTNYDFGVAVAIIGLVIGFVSIPVNAYRAKNTGEPTYKVTISDTVPLAEFFERYEIIDQDGLIYEIKERGE